MSDESTRYNCIVHSEIVRRYRRIHQDFVHIIPFDHCSMTPGNDQELTVLVLRSSSDGSLLPHYNSVHVC